jgi:hypothetical protein
MDTPPNTQGATTAFAPAERASEEEVRALVRQLSDNPLVTTLLESFNGILLVLNENRQIVSANTALLRQLDGMRIEEATGLRPGELFHCTHADEHPGGCGTAEACAFCGAVNAVLAAQRTGRPAAREALLTLEGPDGQIPFEINVLASPLEIAGHRLIVASLRDISPEKRREALEHIFFHDILNTIGGLAGWTHYLEAFSEGEGRRAAERLQLLIERLTEEVRAHRDLIDAEQGLYELEVETIDPQWIFEKLRIIFGGHKAAEEKALVIDNPADAGPIHTDGNLVVRVLTNMAKNALEASPAGAEVRIRHERNEEGTHRFSVWNEGAMPPEVAERVFQRSFSTKGQPGRGLGTYAMRLFGEQYLGGRVRFRTDPAEGTTFVLELPADSHSPAPKP